MVWVIEEKDTSARVPGWYVVEEFESQSEANAREQIYRGANRSGYYRTREIAVIPPSPGYGLPPLTQEVAPQPDYRRPDYAEAVAKQEALRQAKTIAERESISAKPLSSFQRADPVVAAFAQPKVEVAYGGPTKDASPAQIQQAQKEGADYYVSGKRVTPTTPTTREEFASSLLIRQGYDVQQAGKGIIAVKGQTQAYIDPTADIVARSKQPIMYPNKLRAYPGFERELSPKKFEPAERENYIASLFRKQGREVSVSDTGIVSVKPTTGIAGKYERVIVTRPTGFESNLGTGQPKWYATGTLGKAYVFGREVKQNLKSRASSLRENGTRATGKTIVSNDSFININLLGVEKKNERTKTYSSRVVSGYLDIPKSFLIGGGKLLYAPNYYGGKPLIDIGQSKIFETKSFRSDRDIQTFALGASLVPITFVAPRLAIGIGATFWGSQAIKTIKSPTPENIGVLSFMTTLPLLPRTVRAAREAPGRITSTLARRREVPGIIEDAGRPTPYKPIPGLEGTPKIQEAVVRDKPIPGIERASKEILTGSPRKGIITAKESPPGADFKGIARITPEEPLPLTRKGSIIFKELGIEEAGILKSDIPKKKFKMPIILPQRSFELLSLTKHPKVTTYEKVAPFEKLANITTIDFSRPITTSKIKGRASPEQFALQLAEKGEINYYPFVQKKTMSIYFSKGTKGFYSRYGEPNLLEKETIGIAGVTEISPYGPYRQRIIAHELLHYKNPEWLHKLGQNLPYRLQPTEIVSWNLEGFYGKRGFKITEPAPTSMPLGQGTIRKEGPLKFKYERRRLPEKTIGQNQPLVSLGKGTLIQGRKAFDVYTTNIGRQLYGTFRQRSFFDPLFSQRKDIIFKRTKAGEIEYKYISRFGGVKGRYTRPYIPENIKLGKPRTYVKTSEFGKQGFDIGKKAGEESYFDLRNILKYGKYKAIGKSKEFKKGRDIRKFFVGEAQAALRQTDKAGPQTEITKIGNRLLINLRPTTIKYALQPSYKPSAKIYTTDTISGEIIPISKSVQRPKLFTERINRGYASQRYAYRESRYKPLKAATIGTGRFLKGMGKRGELITRQKPVIIETQKPKLTFRKPGKAPIISGEEALGMTIPKTKPFVSAIPLMEKQQRQSQPIRARSEVRPTTKSYAKTFLDIKQDTFSKARSEVRARAETRARTEVITKNEARIRNEVIQKQLQRALQRQRTLQRTQIRSRTRLKSIFAPIPRVPPPPFFPPFRDNKGVPARKKKGIDYRYFYRQFKLKDIRLNGKKTKFKVL